MGDTHDIKKKKNYEDFFLLQIFGFKSGYAENEINVFWFQKWRKRWL